MDPSAFLERLQGVKRSGKGWLACCPAHDDANPSLKIDVGDDGRILLRCHANCSFDSIVAATGFTRADLAGDSGGNGNGGKPRREKVAEYCYTDAEGRPVYYRDRFEWLDHGQRQKAIYPRQLDGSRKGCPPLPYHLHQVLATVRAGGVVVLVEGEKAADALAEHSYTATTTGGATSWRPEFARYFAGARVVLWPDADAPGEEYVAAVARDLEGVATELRVLRFPGAAEHWDAADYFAEGGTPEQLDQLLADAPAWAPAAPPEPEMPAYLTLAALLERPELLAPPESVLPRLAYRGRAVLLAGPDKSGKSTFVADGAAHLTRGRAWLGEAVRRGQVVWCGLEEHISDAVRRFRALEADPERIRLLVLAPPDVLARTRRALDELPADLLVVDSLTEYARVACGGVPDDGDAAGWSAVIRPLVALAREYHLAVIVVHHVRKSDGTYRGSTELAAAVDALLELVMPLTGEDASLRRLRGRGRWPIEPCTLTLDGNDRYQLAGGMPVSLDARVLIYVEDNPGSSRNQVRKNVGGRATAVDAAIDRLLTTGAIANVGTPDRPQLAKASVQGALEGL